MFNTRRKGLSCLQPVGKSYPCRPPKVSVDWGATKGDLQDLRNRMGITCPPSLKFIEMDFNPPRNVRSERQEQMIEYLQAVCLHGNAKRAPIYIDPYGRDTPGKHVQLMPVDYSHWTTQRRKQESRGTNLNARLRQLKESMAEAEERRQMLRRANEHMWGISANLLGDVTLPPKPQTTTVPQVSPHLYKCKSIKPKSEWTTNLELTRAMMRKKDIEDLEVHRLEEHDEHGNLIRLSKLEMDSERMDKLMKKINAKEERFVRAMGKLCKK